VQRRANNAQKDALVPMEWLQGKQQTEFRDNGSDEGGFVRLSAGKKGFWVFNLSKNTTSVLKKNDVSITSLTSVFSRNRC